MKKTIVYIILALYIAALFVPLFVVPVSATAEYNGMVYKFIGGSITVASTPYVTSLPSGTTYTVNSGTRTYNQLRVTTESRATGNAFEAYQSSSGTATPLVVGDILYFDRDIRNLTFTVAWRNFIDTCCEPVPIWEADNSSPYTSIYTTLSHFLFRDNFENVPFGDFWISGASIIACLAICGLPFLIVYWILRRL